MTREVEQKYELLLAFVRRRGREISNLDGETNGKTDVERMIVAHIRTSANTTANEVTTDGGVASENAAESRMPSYTEYIEPLEQGGKKYMCCEGCGRELLTEFGGRNSLAHADDCPNAMY